MGIPMIIHTDKIKLNLPYNLYHIPEQKKWKKKSKKNKHLDHVLRVAKEEKTIPELLDH